MRPRVGGSEHDWPSGEGTDYCAVRERERVAVDRRTPALVAARGRSADTFQLSVRIVGGSVPIYVHRAYEIA